MKRIIIIPILLIANLICSPSFGQQKLDVTYIANSGFLIEHGNKSIIIDALFKQGWDNYLVSTDSIVSNINKQEYPFKKASLMLITHNHGDHFDPSMVADYLPYNE